MFGLEATLRSIRKHRNENQKTRTLVYTLPGTTFNRRTKHRLSSPPRCLTTITHIQQHSRGSGRVEYPILLLHVYIRYFRYHPQEGGNHKQIFFVDVFYQKYFNLLYSGYSSTQIKMPRFQIIYGEEFIECESLIGSSL